MKILHVVPLISDDAAFGGPARGTARQSAALEALGHETLLLALWRGQGSIPQRVMGVSAKLFSFRRLPGHRFATAVNPAAVFWVVKNRKSFDIVHAHAGRDLWILLALIALRITGRSYVLQTHGMLAPRTGIQYRVYDWILTRPAVSGAKALMYLTSYEERDLNEISPHSSKIQIVNGVDDIRNEIASKAHGSPLLRLVFVSRIHPRKRLVDLIDAITLLNSTAVRVTLDIYGPDEGDLESVTRRVAESGQTEFVRYRGPLDYSDVRGTLTEFDVMVLPSVKEPFPNIVLESLAAGVPTLITESCGLAPYLAEHNAGLVVPPGPDGLADGVQRLIGNVELRMTLAKNGQELAARMFTMEGVAHSLVNAYEGKIK